jgi:hypothetical protein
MFLPSKVTPTGVKRVLRGVRAGITAEGCPLVPVLMTQKTVISYTCDWSGMRWDLTDVH